LLCLRRPPWVEAGLWAGLLALAGFAAVRTLTLLVSDGPVRAAILVALALELSGVLLNGWALRRLRRSRGAA
jgi:membrane protein DedA with SNARE-associated domain